MKRAFIIINCSVHWHFIVCIVHSLSLIVLYSYISSVVQPTNDHWYFTNCAGQGRSNFIRSKSSQNSPFRATITEIQARMLIQKNMNLGQEGNMLFTISSDIIDKIISILPLLWSWWCLYMYGNNRNVCAMCIKFVHRNYCDLNC